MANNKVTDKVENLARPIVEELGLELVDIEYVREGANWYLRVYIDKDTGITLSDCEMVSRPLSKKLDGADPIPQAYILEVSSPGVERPFKTADDYEKAIGERVCIRFYKSIKGKKTIEGMLEKFDGDSITVLTEDDKRETYKLDEVSKINRVLLL